MMKRHALSLVQALMLNLNIILGAGVFVNTVVLARVMGGSGWICYALVSLGILPLTLAFARLMKLCHGGSFYHYALPLGRGAAFMSQWTYFVGKLASSTLGLYLGVQLLSPLVYPLPADRMIIVACGGILLAIWIATRNVHIARGMQYAFFVSKMGALCLIIGCAVWQALHGVPYPAQPVGLIVDGATLWATLPLALYSFTGFEATCSLAAQLERPERDGPWAIMGSYVVSVLLAVGFQIAMWWLLGDVLATAPDAAYACRQAIAVVIPEGALQEVIIQAMSVAIATSCIGSAYGSLYSNGNNLATLAYGHHVQGSAWLTALNGAGAPYRCYVIAGTIMLGYLLVTQGVSQPLQQINSMALLITFLLSAIGLGYYGASRKDAALSAFAIGSCTFLLLGAALSVVRFGAWGIWPFVLLVVAGRLLFRA